MAATADRTPAGALHRRGTLENERDRAGSAYPLSAEQKSDPESEQGREVRDRACGPNRTGAGVLADDPAARCEGCGVSETWLGLALCVLAAAIASVLR